ncbi:hypothetical protein QVZ43_00250 [Marinobacter sp. chi1]|uniref:Uncharacterized protein n=1 Tax=Marinobacter suaedae TaxID=3057675 RepID=A0ABT8VVX4_9GAMM|nr:hypothetical protein [Marinobacter sp. chi1]MDO3720131.1 hypothetical protein [Marinobacter sp. chi1]
MPLHCYELDEEVLRSSIERELSPAVCPVNRRNNGALVGMDNLPHREVILSRMTDHLNEGRSKARVDPDQVPMFKSQ